jgi:hypothetical protein
VVLWSAEAKSIGMDRRQNEMKKRSKGVEGFYQEQEQRL